MNIENLKAAMKRCNMSQAQVARAAGITSAAVCRYVSGERVPNSNNVVKIAKAINVSVEYLLTQDGEQYDPFNSIVEKIATCSSELSNDELKGIVNLVMNIALSGRNSEP